MAKITLVVSSSISAYKSLDLLSLLQKNGHEISPLLSKTTQKWLSPTLFRALCRPFTDFSALGFSKGMTHIALAKQSDLIVYVPATANTLYKLAHGGGQDVGSALFLAAKCAVMVCPAMNPVMWNHPNVQKNARILNDLGVFICGPDLGSSACQDWGVGKLLSVSNIATQIETILTSFQKKTRFFNTSILITSGGSQEKIDPVRVLSNISSGTMGSSLAQQAVQLGANVTYLQGRVSVAPPLGPRIISFQNNLDLQLALQKEIPHHQILIMCAAPCDWKIQNPSLTKLSKKENSTLQLEKLPDILSILNKTPQQFFVGFALENNLQEPSILKKIQKKQLDLLVINTPDSLEKMDTNIQILSSTGDCIWKSNGSISKQQAAKQIFAAIQSKMSKAN